MNSKERVDRAIHFQTPDRIPISHACLPGGVKELGDNLKQTFTRYPSDFSGQSPDIMCSLDNPVAQRYLSRDKWTDEWLCTWDFPGLGVEGIPIDGPFYNSWQGLDQLHTPDFAETPTKPDDADHRYVLTGIPGMRLFERMHFIRGFENLLMDILDDRQEIYTLRDKILDWQITNLEPMLDLDWIDCFSYMDDWGTQSALLIPPDRWRTIFRPAYNRLFSIVRNAGKELYFHSDGMILEIIPDLIEAGATILAPQFNCMDLKKLAEFRGKVCFATDIDRQELLPFASPEDIRNNVIETIRALCLPTGGMIGRAEIGPGTPPQNAETAYKTFYEFRF